MRKSPLALSTFLAAAVLVSAVAGAVPRGLSAQQQAPGLQEDPLFGTLYPPELIMQHRRAINLTDEQRDAISRMLEQLQGRVVRLQWELLDRVQQLTETMAAPRVQLDRALDQLNAVLDTERQIKQAHLEMLVRIKNLLRPEQQATLDRLRGSGGG